MSNVFSTLYLLGIPKRPTVSSFPVSLCLLSFFAEKATFCIFKPRAQYISPLSIINRHQSSGAPFSHPQTHPTLCPIPLQQLLHRSPIRWPVNRFPFLALFAHRKSPVPTTCHQVSMSIAFSSLFCPFY